MNNEYYGTVFTIISDHILTNRQKEIDDKNYKDYDYHGLRRGYIIADDQSGEVLGFVKKNLRFDDLKAAGKVHEITIDQTWDHDLRKKDGIPGREAWNELVAAAYKANHGLLVITISNTKFFGQCWKLKHLIKHYEDDLALEPIEPVSREKIAPIDLEFIKGNVPLEVMFDGNVLLVVKDLSWEEVKNYAKRHDEHQFKDMFQFYSLIKWDEE